MIVTITSFSYKRGLPEDKTGNGGGFVFDCRAMPNPYWDESLRGYTGRDKPICDFFVRAPTRSVYFAERMAERLRGIEEVEIEVEHAAKPYWKTTTMRSATRSSPKSCAATANRRKYTKTINF